MKQINSLHEIYNIHCTDPANVTTLRRRVKEILVEQHGLNQAQSTKLEHEIFNKTGDINEYYSSLMDALEVIDIYRNNMEG